MKRHYEDEDKDVGIKKVVDKTYREGGDEAERDRVRTKEVVVEGHTTDGAAQGKRLRINRKRSFGQDPNNRPSGINKYEGINGIKLSRKRLMRR